MFRPWWFLAALVGVLVGGRAFAAAPPRGQSNSGGVDAAPVVVNGMHLGGGRVVEGLRVEDLHSSAFRVLDASLYDEISVLPGRHVITVLDVHFSGEVQIGRLMGSDVQIRGPRGPVAVSGVSLIENHGGDWRYRIELVASGPGEYQVRLLASLADVRNRLLGHDWVRKFSFRLPAPVPVNHPLSQP